MMDGRSASAADSDAKLGGRLTVLQRTELSEAQRTLWDRMDATMGGGWAVDLGFRAKTTDGRFIGPFNPMLRSAETALSFLQLQLDEARHSALSERVRQVVILSVGSVWKAPYELYAHAAAARKAGLSEECVTALVAGAPSPDLSDEEEAARRLALASTIDRMVDDALYAEALERFGEKGLVDFVVLAGCYDLVCRLLNLFAIPAP